MSFKKALLALSFTPAAFAMSGYEAAFRCQKIHDEALRVSEGIFDSNLIKVANEALASLKKIIGDISAMPASDIERLPLEVKRCVALGDLVKTLKEEIFANERHLESADTGHGAGALETKSGHSKKNRKKATSSEKGAIDLSKKLKEIAEGEVKRSKKRTKRGA